MQLLDAAEDEDVGGHREAEEDDEQKERQPARDACPLRLRRPPSRRTARGPNAGSSDQPGLRLLERSTHVRHVQKRGEGTDQSRTAALNTSRSTVARRLDQHTLGRRQAELGVVEDHGGASRFAFAIAQSSICVAPTAPPITTAASAKPIQPKVAVFQWPALQRPARPAMFSRFIARPLYPLLPPQDPSLREGAHRVEPGLP